MIHPPIPFEQIDQCHVWKPSYAIVVAIAVVVMVEEMVAEVMVEATAMVAAVKVAVTSCPASASAFSAVGALASSVRPPCAAAGAGA